MATKRDRITEFRVPFSDLDLPDRSIQDPAVFEAYCRSHHITVLADWRGRPSVSIADAYKLHELYEADHERQRRANEDGLQQSAEAYRQWIAGQTEAARERGATIFAGSGPMKVDRSYAKYDFAGRAPGEEGYAGPMAGQS